MCEAIRKAKAKSVEYAESFTDRGFTLEEIAFLTGFEIHNNDNQKNPEPYLLVAYAHVDPGRLFPDEWEVFEQRCGTQDPYDKKWRSASSRVESYPLCFQCYGILESLAQYDQELSRWIIHLPSS